ncbi:uncharacterized protein [Drosophila virilis]|uniref:DUF753 domain-containing protein n=1 Tax=Drosophila virilis TaxID=7244 RepID=B4LM48_DROVI|nr:uncharacterized protein LOC6627158 [Drosophila virilis]EDW60926.1 uncharacterized protein Dvir_GJ20590 [Drosophila virilis]
MLPQTAVILLLCLPLAFATESREAAVNASTPRTCYSCEGINCQRTTLQDVTVKCNDLLDTCVTVFEGFMVSEKGCQLELSLAAQAKCDARDIQCQKCSGELCNNQGRIDFQCIQCNGLENADCNSAGDSISPSRCPAPTASNAYCYVKSVDTHLQRGCSLNVKEQQSCLKDSDCSLCLPEDAHGSTACNNYALDMKSGAGRGQQLLGLLLAVLSLVAVQGSH